MKVVVFAYHDIGCTGIEALLEAGYEIRPSSPTPTIRARTASSARSPSSAPSTTCRSTPRGREPPALDRAHSRAGAPGPLLLLLPQHAQAGDPRHPDRRRLQPARLPAARLPRSRAHQLVPGQRRGRDRHHPAPDDRQARRRRHRRPAGGGHCRRRHRADPARQGAPRRPGAAGARAAQAARRRHPPHPAG